MNQDEQDQNQPQGTSSPKKTSRKLKDAFSAEELRKAAPIIGERARQAGGIFQSGIRRFFPTKGDNPELRYFKLLGLSLLGLLFLGVVTALAFFLLSLKSPEGVRVPDVTKQDLAYAMEKLQTVQLLGSVELVYDADPTLKGKVLAQDPAAAASVRVGRVITLKVSKGPVLDKVAAYIGRNIEEVKSEILKQFGVDNPVLSIGSIDYLYNDADVGTILGQSPVESTELTKATTISFQVSKGKNIREIDLTSLSGLFYLNAIGVLAAQNVSFDFVEDPKASVDPGVVSAQVPAAGKVSLDGLVVHLTVRPLKSDHPTQVVGLYSNSIPNYEVPVDVDVFALDNKGTRTKLLGFKSIGGTLSFPYAVEKGSELIVEILGHEIDRRLIQGN